MNMQYFVAGRMLTAAAAVLLGAGLGTANAKEPCEDFGECKVLIEINATDGDAGLHFLADGDDLIRASMYDPNGQKIFSDTTRGPLREQTLTELFAESAEPLCWFDPEADEDEDIDLLEDFLERWTPGTYEFIGQSEEGEMSFGETELSFALPAAPQDVDFDGKKISWIPGNDLGNCAELVDTGEAVPDLSSIMHLLVEAPAGVDLASFEVVFEPDVENDDPEDQDPRNGLNFSVRVPPTETSVTVPKDYIKSLGADTPIKIEVGAIGLDDNATFTEEDGFCVNEVEGCDD